MDPLASLVASLNGGITIGDMLSSYFSVIACLTAFFIISFIFITILFLLSASSDHMAMALYRGTRIYSTDQRTGSGHPP